MQVEKKLFCHWDLVRFVTEDYLLQEDGTFVTLSVTDGENSELMIFLGKDESNSEYEVRVYKNDPNDKYVPNEFDNVKSYEENNEYASFFFDEYEDAHEFTESIGYNHPEFSTRPVKEIED